MINNFRSMRSDKNLVSFLSQSKFDDNFLLNTSGSVPQKIKTRVSAKWVFGPSVCVTWSMISWPSSLLAPFILCLINFEKRYVNAHQRQQWGFFWDIQYSMLLIHFPPDLLCFRRGSGKKAWLSLTFFYRAPNFLPSDLHFLLWHSQLPILAPWSN